MIRRRRYIFRKPPRTPRVIAILLALLAGAALVFLVPRPSANVTARMEGGGPDRVLIVDVEGTEEAKRFEIPAIGLAEPLVEGQAQLRIPADTLPAEGTKLAYVVKGPWYSTDLKGEIDFERPSANVHYVATVKPDGAGGAWLTIKGERGNHLLLFDPAGKVALSGRHADLAGPDGAARVRFSAPEMNAAQREDGPTTARLSVTSPSGEVSDNEIILRETPTRTVQAVVLFPPKGASTERSVVRLRVLTEPGATVLFGDAPAGLSGPSVEFDWPIPGGGKHTLDYEVRSAGLKPARGTIEIERIGNEGDKPAGESAAVAVAPALSEGALRRDAGSLAGERVELAGKVLARPAPLGSLEMIEIGPGGSDREVAVVFPPDAFPPLRDGDRVIVRGRAEGTQRLRTASGQLREMPKVRADEVIIPSQAESASLFESRYATILESFWRDADDPAPTPTMLPPTDRVFAAAEPWPEPLSVQPRQPVLASEMVSGLGDRLPPERLALPEPQPVAEEETAAAPVDPEKPDAPAPVAQPAPPEAPERPEPKVEVAREAGGGLQAGPPPAATELVRVPRTVDPEKRERLDPGPSVRVDRVPGGEVPGIAGVPPITEVPIRAEPPGRVEEQDTPPDWAWTRDRALESELTGRGVSGVRILRRGRSIRLRGTVPDDGQIRSLYQFMNDKGFGEVDYGVEVR
ncbi:MAG: hypothetical protein Q8R92_15265 [Deltaproteobacteria bacterium]|nr:hypothetical protein [Deltaproteobacteria bacterium]